MALQIVSGRPRVIPQAVPSTAAEDLAGAAQTLLGFVKDAQGRQFQRELQEDAQGHESGLEAQRERAAKERLTLGFGHDERMQGKEHSFRTGERLGAQEYGTSERVATQGFQSEEAGKQRTWQSSENAEDRTVTREGQRLGYQASIYGSNASAGASRYATDRQVELTREGRTWELTKMALESDPRFNPQLRTRNGAAAAMGDYNDWLGQRYPLGIPRTVDDDAVVQQYIRERAAVSGVGGGYGAAASGGPRTPLGAPTTAPPPAPRSTPRPQAGIPRLTPEQVAASNADPRGTVDALTRPGSNHMNAQQTEAFIIRNFGNGSAVHSEWKRRNPTPGRAGFGSVENR